jgi:hypothetical protein
MSQPFSRIPDAGGPRPRRHLQPGVVQETLARAWHQARQHGESALRTARRHGQDLWQRGKRRPRTFGLIGAAVALTLGSAYALSASNQSLCPPAGKGKAAGFLLLMDRVPQAAAGAQLEIHYDVCGLPSDTPYSGKVRLTRQVPGAKKKAPKPKPLVVTFKDQVDGPATRRSQELNLGATKPGAYTLELSVTDNKGRERKRLQKVVIKAP